MKKKLSKNVIFVKVLYPLCSHSEFEMKKIIFRCYFKIFTIKQIEGVVIIKIIKTCILRMFFCCKKSKIEIGSNRKRDRPRKTKPTLKYQDDIEYVHLETDSESASC